MEIGKYYYWNEGKKVIFQVTGLQKLGGSGGDNIPCHKLIVDGKEYINMGAVARGLTLNPATEQQIEWLEQCKAAGKYVDYQPVVNGEDYSLTF